MPGDTYWNGAMSGLLFGASLTLLFLLAADALHLTLESGRILGALIALATMSLLLFLAHHSKKPQGGA